MADKITYENKELLQNDETIPNKNKVTAKDLNEIKEVVNNHAENIDTKQDKEEGKGLTSNDFTNEYKEKLESLENYNDTEVKESIRNLQSEDTKIKSSLDTKVEKREGKGLSQNDFTDNYRSKLDNLSNYDDTILKTQINRNTDNIEELKESKVEKVAGKVLSSNDFTNTYKQKLEDLENYNDTNVKARISTLETDNAENKQDIENMKEKDIDQDTKIQTNTEDIETIKEENAELKAECERLKEDISSWPTVVDSSENVILKDTAEARFKRFEISGNTIQEGEPSLESPAEIKNVKEGINITVCNKNLFDNNRLEELFRYDNPTEVNGNVVRVTNNKETNVEYSSFGVFGTQGVEIAKLLQIGKTYSFSAKTNGKYGTENGSDTVQVFIQFTNKDGTINIYDLGASLKKSLVISKEITKISWRLDVNSTGHTYDFWDFQVEEGEIATEYEEHQEQNFLFPLKEGQVLHKTDYLAEDGIHYKRKTMVVDGVNYKTTYVFPSGWFQLKDMIHNELVIVGNPCKNWALKEEIYCDKLPCISQADMNQRGYKGIAISQSGNISIKFDNSVEENRWNIEAVNNYLIENNLIIEYILPEEVIEVYTTEQITVLEEIKKTGRSYKGTTHIYSVDEISPILEVEARKDLQVENDKLQTQIDEIKELLSTTTTSAMLLDNMQTDLEKEVI